MRAFAIDRIAFEVYINFQCNKCGRVTYRKEGGKEDED